MRPDERDLCKDVCLWSAIKPSLSFQDTSRWSTCIHLGKWPQPQACTRLTWGSSPAAIGCLLDVSIRPNELPPGGKQFARV